MWLFTPRVYKHQQQQQQRESSNRATLKWREDARGQWKQWKQLLSATSCSSSSSPRYSFGVQTNEPCGATATATSSTTECFGVLTTAQQSRNVRDRTTNLRRVRKLGSGKAAARFRSGQCLENLAIWAATLLDAAAPALGLVVALDAAAETVAAVAPELAGAGGLTTDTAGRSTAGPVVPMSTGLPPPSCTVAGARDC